MIVWLLISRFGGLPCFRELSVKSPVAASNEVPSVTTKAQMLKAIQELPDDAIVEDAMERLYFLYKVERGIAQADSGHKVSQEEARRLMQR